MAHRAVKCHKPVQGQAQLGSRVVAQERREAVRNTTIGCSMDCSLIPFSEAELARLITQADLFLRYEGGLAPESEGYLAGCRSVLDLACGPGGWALQVAATYPGLQVTGVDISEQMLEYARARARARGLTNVHYQLADITQPFPFPNHVFDLVNARFLQGVLSPGNWRGLVRECLRVLRPGGLLRLTEGEIGVSNLPSTSRLLHLLPLALHHTGRSFSPDGHSMAITCMLGHFLRAEGYREVRARPFVVDSSVGTAAYHRFTEFLRVTFSPHLLGEYFLRAGVLPAQEYDALYQRALREMSSDQFCAIAYFLTVIGEKPL